MKIGYARVSTLGQSLDVQLEKLQKAGCEKVYQEKASGKSREGRGELNKLLESVIREGDCLIVAKLDRLARSVLDLSQIAKQLESLGASLVVLDDNIDTSTPQGRLYFHLISAIGEFERHLILQRTEEGRQKAKAKQEATGKRIFGRKDKLSDFQKKKLKEDFDSWDGVKADLAKHYGISTASMYRIVREMEAA